VRIRLQDASLLFERSLPQRGEFVFQDSPPRKLTDNHSGDMPRWNIDKLMTHIAAAALIVDDFEVDVNDLRDDLKIENNE